MKNIKFLMMMVLALGLTFTTPAKVQAEDTKIAYVDLSRLFDEYYKTKEQDKVLESQFKEFEAEHKTKAEEIQASKSKLSLLTDDKKADLEKEIQAKTIALQRILERLKH